MAFPVSYCRSSLSFMGIMERCVYFMKLLVLFVKSDIDVIIIRIGTLHRQTYLKFISPALTQIKYN